jgi:hypothetical protein
MLQRFDMVHKFPPPAEKVLVAESFRAAFWQAEGHKREFMNPRHGGASAA